MNKIYFLIFILLLVGIPLASFAWVHFKSSQSNNFYPVTQEEYDIQIKGDKECIQDTNDALDNLRVATPDEYSNVKKYVGIIECKESNSGIAVFENPPRFQVGRATYASTYGSMTYAAVLAHEACHSRLYREYLALHQGQKVPGDVYSGRNGESKCIDVQVKVLEKLGASSVVINYTKNQINSNYWETKNRWW